MSLCGGDGVEDGRDGRPGEVRAAVERRLDERDVVLGHPALGDERLLRHVEAEEVEAVVDRLDLPHLGEPQLQAACSSRDQPVENEKKLSYFRTFFPNYSQSRRTFDDALPSVRGWC